MPTQTKPPTSTLHDWAALVPGRQPVMPPEGAHAWSIDKLRLASLSGVVTDDRLAIHVVVNDRRMCSIPFLVLLDNGWFTLSAPWPLDVGDIVMLRTDLPCQVAVAGSYMQREPQ